MITYCHRGHLIVKSCPALPSLDPGPALSAQLTIGWLPADEVVMLIREKPVDAAQGTWQCQVRTPHPEVQSWTPIHQDHQDVIETFIHLRPSHVPTQWCRAKRLRQAPKQGNSTQAGKYRSRSISENANV